VLAAKRQPALAGCWRAACRKLADTDLHTTSKLHLLPPAVGSCRLRGMARWRLTGADDLYTALAASQQPAAACCCEEARREKHAGADDLYTETLLPYNRQPAPAGCGGLTRRKLASEGCLYTARAATWQTALAGFSGCSAES
jgi:hypothetical protein